MAHFRTGCMVCGKPLRYLELPEQHECSYCHRVQVTNALCDDGHFVCDRCHSLGADDAIEQDRIRTKETDPILMAITLMQNPVVNMHGPEHHFLVPAVLLAAYCNVTGQPIKGQTNRNCTGTSRDDPGRCLWFMGDCGAAVGTGIFISL